MENLYFKQFGLKKARIGVRLSKEERNKIDDFCLKNGVIISELVRYAVCMTLNEEKSSLC